MEGERFINVRKLAALDLYYRGSRFILLEFGFVVFGIGSLGFLSVILNLTKSTFTTAIGVYLLCLSLDYLPLFVYGVVIARKGSAKTEIALELADETRFRRKYGVQQALLMVPLFMAMLALSQELRGRRETRISVQSAPARA